MCTWKHATRREPAQPMTSPSRTALYITRSPGETRRISTRPYSWPCGSINRREDRMPLRHGCRNLSPAEEAHGTPVHRHVPPLAPMNRPPAGTPCRDAAARTSVVA